MRVRVELRRRDGIWIARFQKQAGFVGQLTSGRQQIDDRFALYLTLTAPEPTTHGVAPDPPPILFKPRIIESFDDQLRLSGLERTVERAWCLQEWDCFVLPELRHRIVR